MRQAMRVVRPLSPFPVPVPVPPCFPRVSHISHACSLCMRGDHFRGQFVPVWGCGEHTKMLIMASQAPALVVASTAYTEISGARRRGGTWPPMTVMINLG
jgi:hypothetical protein